MCMLKKIKNFWCENRIEIIDFVTNTKQNEKQGKKKQEEIEVKCVCVHRFSDGLPEFDDIDYYCPIRSSLWGRIGIIGQVQWLRGIKRQFKPDITISTLFSTSFINVLSGGSGKTYGCFGNFRGYFYSTCRNHRKS